MTDKIEVTQADQEAALEVLTIILGMTERTISVSDADKLIRQAFARHRVASPPKPRTAATFTRARIRAQCDVMRAKAGLAPAQWPE
jgi:hypothetical protein